MLGAAYITCDVLEIDVYSEFIIVKKVLFAEFAVRMQENNIAELIDVPTF